MFCVIRPSDLLLSDDDDDELEVTYNAGGIISHLAFDGACNWTNPEVSREQALQRLVRCVVRSNSALLDLIVQTTVCPAEPILFQ